MNHYRTSTGERVSKATIDRKIRQAKFEKLQEQMVAFGYNFCEDCKRNETDTYLDCSHNISVDQCQKSGRAELAWDVQNITILCRDCHKKKDKLHLQHENPIRKIQGNGT